MVFDGTTVDDTIITDVYLMQANIDFTLVMEFTNNNTPPWNMLLFCMDSNTPYAGYSFTVTDTNRQYRFMTNEGEYWYARTNNVSDVIRFVYVHRKDNGACSTYMSVNGTNRNRTNYYSRTVSSSLNKPLCIGGSLANNLRKGTDVWNGALNTFTIFDRICTNSEINTFLSDGTI